MIKFEVLCASSLQENLINNNNNNNDDDDDDDNDNNFQSQNLHCM